MRWQNLFVPLSAGLQTGADARALQAPGLTTLQNGEFTETGGIQKRKPFTALSTDTAAGGTIENLRRLAVYRDELLLFTDAALYSWSEADSSWVERGAYLAPAVQETTVFARTAEQVSGDRASLNGVVWYSWLEKGDQVFLAARDATTGATLYPPTAQGPTTERARLISLTSRVLFFVRDGSTLKAKSLDPDNIATTANAAFTTIIATTLRYDVARLSATKCAFVKSDSSSTAQYDVGDVDESLTVTVTNKVRACDGPIALAVTSDQTTAVVVCRGNGTAIRGDVLTTAFGDSVVDVALGTASSSTVNQLTCNFRSVADGGRYRCFAVWSSGETANGLGFDCEYNFVDDGGTAGVEANVGKRLGVASHAFDHGGQIYVWTVFATGQTANSVGLPGAQVQNGYFLFRLTDEGPEWVAHSVRAQAGGFAEEPAHLGQVEATGGSSYAWCGSRQKRISLGDKGTGYAERALQDVVVHLDSTEARRTVELGNTLYGAGSPVWQYDGEGIAEVGYMITPYTYDTIVSGAGSLGAGDYEYSLSWRWANGAGEIDRAARDAVGTIAVLASREVLFSIGALPVTRKQGARTAPAVEVWRTQVDPTVDAAVYLTTSNDPSTTGDNRHVVNDAAVAFLPSYIDDMVDATLASQELAPSASALIPRPPPPSTVLAVSDDRLFLAGIAGYPYTVWYSTRRSVDAVVAMNDALQVDVPAAGGEIRGLALLNGTLVVFCARAIYALPGEGVDNIGQGSNPGPSQILSGEVGLDSAEAMTVVSEGVFFHGPKGWHLLDRGLAVHYVGEPVRAYDGDTWVSVQAMAGTHQIRCTSTNRIIVYDTVVKQWAEWPIVGIKDAVQYKDTFYYCDSTTVYKQDAAHGSPTNYSLVVETAWLKLAGATGYQRCRQLQVLGEYRSAHDLKLEIGYDYEANYGETKTWTVSPTTVGDGELVKHSVARQKVRAIRIRITDRAVASDTAPGGEGLQLTALGLQIGVLPGLARLPGAQTQ